jgi:hypothetical protein
VVPWFVDVIFILRLAIISPANAIVRSFAMVQGWCSTSGTKIVCGETMGNPVRSIKWYTIFDPVIIPKHLHIVQLWYQMRYRSPMIWGGDSLPNYVLCATATILTTRKMVTVPLPASARTQTPKPGSALVVPNFDRSIVYDVHIGGGDRWGHRTSTTTIIYINVMARS